jgi:enterochelin esterase-like enzyme
MNLRPTLAAIGSLAFTLTAMTGASAVHRSDGHQAADSARPDHQTALSPTVTHTRKGPTGYTVTFHFRAPSAASVQIKGEWYFGNPYELSKLAGTSATDVVQTPGTLPADWAPGDIPLPYPNSNAANWPVATMTKSRNGVWTYTTPLPSGTFSYGFYVDCSDPAQSGCTEVNDPANPPWNRTSGATSGSTEPVSQVYVPSDPAFRTEDLTWQAPAKERGALRDLNYEAPTSVTPAGKNYLSVYTPPGYDRHRATPYPTVYMLAPDNEVAWGSQGALRNTLDNLISTGQIQPMVVVMPNMQGFPATADSSAVDANLIDTVIPYVESRYNVSPDASRRSVGGLGYGASVANSLLYGHTASFGSYGIFSPGIKGPYTLPTTLTDAQVAALHEVNILVGGGWQDPSHWYHASEVDLLTDAGVSVLPDFVNGGHNWYSWRFNAKDFLTRAAFLPGFSG